MNCIIYIQTKDLQHWNQYMWNLRTNEPSLPPSFKTSMELLDEHHEWVQMLIPMDDLQRIYDMMDRVRQMRTGTTEQPDDVPTEQMMPA